MNSIPVYSEVGTDLGLLGRSAAALGWGRGWEEEVLMEPEDSGDNQSGTLKLLVFRWVHPEP